MKRALMRGVCALNLEAMAVMSKPGGGPSDAGVDAHRHTARPPHVAQPESDEASAPGEAWRSHDSPPQERHPAPETTVDTAACQQARGPPRSPAAPPPLELVEASRANVAALTASMQWHQDALAQSATCGVGEGILQRHFMHGLAEVKAWCECQNVAQVNLVLAPDAVCQWIPFMDWPLKPIL